MELVYDSRDLIPAVVQDDASGEVLMVAWMNAESLELTQQSGEVHFWSRSRETLWKKGETSGNILYLRKIFVDCDADTLLVKVNAMGPACHTGTRTCFYRTLDEE
jgi:phosphoribosyl-AMP cyclohydrolase